MSIRLLYSLGNTSRWENCMSVENLSNDLIIEAYHKAIELKLDDDFQVMLKKELMRRNLEISHS